MKKSPTTISRDADKFVLRMPDDMRPRFTALAEKQSTSMNTVMVHGLTSYLDGLEELEILISGVRLLRTSLEEKQKALDADLAAVAELKAKLEAKLGSGSED